MLAVALVAFLIVSTLVAHDLAGDYEFILICHTIIQLPVISLPVCVDTKM